MKKKSNTGIRNGDLFCFNCGGNYKMPLPQPITMVTALMNQFAKDHQNCEKGWAEPINDVNGKTEIQNADWWAINGAHGTSSKTMFNHFSTNLPVRGLKNDRPSHPYDPDDFSRCYKLLQAVPQWKLRLEELKTISPVWVKLVDNWDKLTEMYEKNVLSQWKDSKKIGMCEFMEVLTH